MPLMDDAFDLADAVLADLYGVAVVYARGDDSVAVTARVAVQNAQTIDAAGIVAVETGSRDYLVAAAELVLNGTATRPQRGDRISETIAGVVRTFEVLPIGDQTCCMEADPGGKTLLVHTKEVA